MQFLYLLGKERVFISIAQAFDWKIWANNVKKKVFLALEDANILERFSDNPFNATVHVIDMVKVKDGQFLNEYLEKYSHEYRHILSIIPTGWTHQKGSSAEHSLKNMKVKFLPSHKNVWQLEVPYSEHSSFSELKRFVKFLKLSNASCIIPTVNVGNPQSREKMTNLFKSWILNNK